MNQLKGTIEYTLTLGEGGVWQLSYNQTIDNDIASIAISEHVLGILGEKLKLDKKSAKGKEVGFLAQRIEKITQAKFGLSLMFDYTVKLYDLYKKAMAVKAEEAAKKDESDAAEEETKIVNLNPFTSPTPLTAQTEATKNVTDLSENKQ